MNKRLPGSLLIGLMLLGGSGLGCGAGTREHMGGLRAQAEAQALSREYWKAYGGSGD